MQNSNSVNYALAVSLGFDCQTRFHISRIVRQDQRGNVTTSATEKNSELLDYGSHFFDWSVSPIEAVIKTLDNHFLNNFIYENLEIIKIADNRQTVIDHGSGLRYPHTFSLCYTGQLTYAKLKIAFEEVKHKFSYLAEKTMTVLNSQEKILFVINIRFKTIDKNFLLQVQYLYNILKSFSDSNDLLLAVLRDYNNDEPLPTITELDENIHLREGIFEEYPGNFIGWDNIMSDFKLYPRHRKNG